MLTYYSTCSKRTTYYGLPSNPAFSSKLIGYQITGRFPTGNKALGILSVRGNKREPVPAAIITAWNSTIFLETFWFVNCFVKGVQRRERIDHRLFHFDRHFVDALAWSHSVTGSSLQQKVPNSGGGEGNGAFYFPSPTNELSTHPCTEKITSIHEAPI